MSTAPFLSSSWYRVSGLRPRLREHAIVHRHRYRGDIWYVVHDHATGRLHRLSPAGYLFVAAMDGNRSVDDLWQEAMARLGQEAPSQDEVIYLLAQLHSANLLQAEISPDFAELLERATRTDRSRWLQNVLNPLAPRIQLWHPDTFLERTVPLVRWLFGWRGAALWLLVVVPAIVLAAEHWHELGSNGLQQILAADNLLQIALSYPILKALHELGHGYAVKAFGGTAHEFGIMFIVFAPLPYVDVSAASEFRSKWQRAIVGAAGMLVEVFVAALALYVWLAVEPGWLRSLAFNVMLIAGVSTVFFNGNPLLRYDGYYILSDIIEIPNLATRATRYWGYLASRYAFRTEDQEFAATRGERLWFFFYAPASFLYRQIVLLAIALFIASEYVAVGIAIALWSLLTGVVFPAAKALWQVLAGPRFRKNRARAVTTTIGSVVAASVILFLIPAPLYTTTEGVVWLPDTAAVRAGTGGMVQRLLAMPGQSVAAGEALIESEEPELGAGLEYLRARVTEFEARLAAERFNDRVKAEMTRTELAEVRSALATQTLRADRLVARSQGEGTFALMKADDLLGRFVKEGELLGYVLPSGSHIVRATVRQDDIDLVRNHLRSTRVKLAERLEEPMEARLIREVPSGREDLPSKALGGAGGGTVPIDMRDQRGMKAFQRVFQVDIELPPDARAATAFGSRAYVRFDHAWEPIGQQIWRRTRQLLLSRLQS